MPYPDRPHFAWPFTRGANGKVSVVEQGSHEHITGQIYGVTLTPLGFRDARPEFGWPWPEFEMVPLDLAPLRNAIHRFVPDAEVVITEWPDVLSEAIRHIRIEERTP